MDRIVPAEIFGPARTASPSVVSVSRLRMYRSKRSRSSCISSVKGPSSRPDTAGIGTMREPVQQGSGLPVAEHAALIALLVMRKDLERTHVTRRYQLQHPHFRRAKPGRAHREVLRAFQHALPKLRQAAEILAQQIEPVLRRRWPIGAARPCWRLRDDRLRILTAREPPFGQILPALQLPRADIQCLDQ